MFALAERNRVLLPYPSVAKLWEAYVFTCWQDSLNIYHEGTKVLCTEQDFLT